MSFTAEISLCNNDINILCANGVRSNLKINENKENVIDVFRACIDNSVEPDESHTIKVCSSQGVKGFTLIIEELDWKSNITLRENNRNDSINVIGYHKDDMVLTNNHEVISYQKIIDESKEEAMFCLQKNFSDSKLNKVTTICGKNSRFVSKCFIQFKDSTYKVKNSLPMLKLDSLEEYGIPNANDKWSKCLLDTMDYKIVNYSYKNYDYIFASPSQTVGDLFKFIRKNMDVIEDSRFGDNRYIKYKIRIK